MKSPKTCSVDNCSNPSYMRGYCTYHYRSIYLYNKSKDKVKKLYSIPKVSKKTLKRNKIYTSKRETFIEDQRKLNNGKLYCIFCGKLIRGSIDVHHGLGRDDDVMLDTKFWFTAHNYCHVHQYHSMGYEKIPWWNSYMCRIFNIPEIYKIEINKMEK